MRREPMHVSIKNLKIGSYMIIHRASDFIPFLQLFYKFNTTEARM